MSAIRCWPSRAAYHAWWRARGYGVARRAALIVLCASVAGGVGGAGTVIRGALAGSHAAPSAFERGVQLDAP
jgi:hypothetical protein